MQLVESLRIAFHCMRAHRLRSVLTMCGIVVSVSLVIAATSFDSWLVTGLRKEFGDVAELVTVTQAAPSGPGVGSSRVLDNDDVAALRNEINPSVANDVIPVVQGPAGIRFGSVLRRSTVSGVGPDYLTVSGLDLQAGSMFTAQQYQDSARVAVLGPTLAGDLFGGNGDDAIGRIVLIGRIPFKVIGIVQVTGKNNNDNYALTSTTAARNYLLGAKNLVGAAILVRANGTDKITDAVTEINRVLDQRHAIADPQYRDFSVSTNQVVGYKLDHFVDLINVIFVALTGLALLIGTVGLANVMLITVTDRTHEIGIRKAIGARCSAILGQFLVESALIAGVAGLFGVLIGSGLVVGATPYFTLQQPTWVSPKISPGAVAIAFALSLLVGVVAGCYPARRASRMHPIRAIRH